MAVIILPLLGDLSKRQYTSVFRQIPGRYFFGSPSDVIYELSKNAVQMGKWITFRKQIFKVIQNTIFSVKTDQILRLPVIYACYILPLPVHE